MVSGFAVAKGQAINGLVFFLSFFEIRSSCVVPSVHFCSSRPLSCSFAISFSPLSRHRSGVVRLVATPSHETGGGVGLCVNHMYLWYNARLPSRSSVSFLLFNRDKHRTVPAIAYRRRVAEREESRARAGGGDKGQDS